MLIILKYMLIKNRLFLIFRSKEIHQSFREVPRKNSDFMESLKNNTYASEEWLENVYVKYVFELFYMKINDVILSKTFL